MKDINFKEVLLKPIFKGNPVTVLVLGICSSLAVTVQLKGALVMALSVTIVTGLSSFVVSIIRNSIPNRIRIIVQLVVVALMVILVDQILKAYSYSISKQLSVYVGLIITNCIVMGRIEAYALGNKPIPSLLDGLANGAGYGLILVVVAFFRELLGSGTLFGFRIIPQSFYDAGYMDNGLVILPPMALILLGLIVWIQRSFQKDLEVYTNASEEPVYLHMQGRVVSKLSDYSGSFPVDLGHVRLNIDNVEFDNVNRGDRPMVELQIVNTGRKSYKPYLMHLPSYLSAQYFPEQLNGGRMGKILLTLDSEKLHQMGLTQTSVYLARKMGDKVSDENEITVSAVLLPDFSFLSAAERLNAPRLELSADTIDMEPLGRKRKRTMEVEVRNTGKSTLEVRSLQVFNRALTVSLSERNSPAGGAAKMKVTVLAKYLDKVKGSPRVLLITNDPARSKEIITVNVKQ